MSQVFHIKLKCGILVLHERNESSIKSSNRSLAPSHLNMSPSSQSWIHLESIFLWFWGIWGIYVCGKSNILGRPPLSSQGLHLKVTRPSSKTRGDLMSRQLLYSRILFLKTLAYFWILFQFFLRSILVSSPRLVFPCHPSQIWVQATRAP